MNTITQVCQRDRRDALAAAAPISHSMVEDVFGDYVSTVADASKRAAYFAVRAALCYEWADTMIAVADKKHEPL